MCRTGLKKIYYFLSSVSFFEHSPLQPDSLGAKNMKQKNLILPALVIAAGVLISAHAFAQVTAPAPSSDLMPPVTPQSAAAPSESADADTHPTLNLMPDKSELVHLDREAASVVVGNSSSITVMLDSPRLAVVIPRAAGATYFSILDKDGNVIMQRHVVVAAPKKNYVRVRRSCANAATGKDCKPTSVYFCPDMCHEIGAASANGAGSAPAGSSTE